MTITLLAVYRNLNVSVCFLQKKSKNDSNNAQVYKENDKQEEMKESKAVYVTKHKIFEDQNLVYKFCRSDKESSESKTNFSCQYDSLKDNKICTCKNVIRKQQGRCYSGMPRLIYAYHGSRSFTDIGVSSVKALPKRKVKKIYLPETDDIGVGSSLLSTSRVRKSRGPEMVIAMSSYYDHKKTSSKCVGGILEYNTGCVINEKLSPIIQTKSGATSPKMSLEINNNDIGSNTIDKQYETIGTQVKIENNEEKQEAYTETIEVSDVRIKPVKKVSEQTQKFNSSHEFQVDRKKQEIEKVTKDIDKTYSSDSFVQHVHNLESPSEDKHSRSSLQDPMENKLEREYRKMFSTTKSKDAKPSCDKPVSTFKSTSVLKRRFEALRRGLVRKNDSNPIKNDSVIVKTSTRESCPSHKDVSVTSDPPSLIARSISNSKKYSPNVHEVEQYRNKTSPDINEKYDTQWTHNATESECQGVKGMFKLWGKKFNFEEENTKNQTTPIPSYDTDNKPGKEIKSDETDSATKKQGKKFFFFNKKTKDKTKDAYKAKQDVTTGRCEIGDGLTWRLEGASTSKEILSKKSAANQEIIRKAWLQKFLTNKIESARSVNVRWNNSMYATSSSTMFELLDTVYKNNAIILRSQSEITTENSSYYKSYTKHKINFVQDIEAWMIPKTIPDRIIKQIPLKIYSNQEIKGKNIEVTISDHKWYINKSETLFHTIEVVLRSENISKPAQDKVSSEYLKFDIPHDFFDTSSNESKRNQSSDEEVYKVVEYETNSDFKEGKAIAKNIEKGDHDANNINIIVNVQESNFLAPHIEAKVNKEAPELRDVVIQGSLNYEVGIMTQRDLREMINPSLKIQDELTDPESEEVLQPAQKKCEFAESYLQEYYNQCTPLGIDVCSWSISNSNIKSSSEKSFTSFHNPENGSKTCPNVYDDFQWKYSTSCISSNSHVNYDQCAIKENCFSAKLFKRSKKSPSKSKIDTDMVDKRHQPKDSLEVFKRRKLYAASAKSQWASIDFGKENKPVSVPSVERGAQNSTIADCPRDTSILKPKKRNCKKYVSFPDCETMNSLLNRQLGDAKPEGILQFKSAASGCDACKKKGSKCSKHTVVCPEPSCEIPQPPCKTSCEELANPPCNKPHSPSCNVTPSTPQSPCRPLPCPSSRTPCSRSPNNNSLTPLEISFISHNDSIFSQPNIPQPSATTLRSTCCKHRSSATSSKRSEPTSNNSASRCSTPCKLPPPCPKPSRSVKKKISPPPCQEALPPACKNPSKISWKKSKSESSSPRRKRKSNSPCKKLSPPCSQPQTPPCAKPLPTPPPPPPCAKPPPPPCAKPLPPCKKPSPPPCTKPSAPPCPCTTSLSPLSKNSLSCPVPSPPVTRCSLPKPCPVMNPPPCPGKTCPDTPPPCKKSRSHRPRCKKLLRAPPCKSNPLECCHDISSCDMSRKSQQSIKECQPSVNSQPNTKDGSKEVSDDAKSCSSQISLPSDSSCTSSKSSDTKVPPCVPKRSQTPPKNFKAGPGSKTGLLLRQCPTPPIKKSKKSPCNFPPCDQLKKQSNKITTSQKEVKENSCPPSPKQDATRCTVIKPKKKTNECKQSCSMESLPPKDQNYKPDSPNLIKVQEKLSNQSCIEDICFKEPEKCPPPAYIRGSKCPPKSIYPPCPVGTKSKISGIFLKMNPSGKKTCADDCTAWELSDEVQGIVKLSSQEKITIKVNRRTPSTEEIRECGEPKNMKVLDEDGKTLYERKDYNCTEHHRSVLGGMYRDSNINRVSTPIAVSNLAECNRQLPVSKSDQSLANSIEIQLRITQGDKTTDINIANENERKPGSNCNIAKVNPDVFVVKSTTEKIAKSDTKNDINIKIVVRNFKPKRKKREVQRTTDDEFFQKISAKFNTVSTGYSDVNIDKNSENIIPVHRTAINLVSSTEGSNIQNKTCNEALSKELTQSEPNLTISTHSTEQMPTDVTEGEFNDVKSVSSKRDSQSQKIEEINANESDLPDFNDTDEQDAALLQITSNECTAKKEIHASKETKKGLLKKLFHRVGKTEEKSKKNVRQLRDMLKVILTDSSDNEARNINSNDLIKDVTLASMKSNYFKNTDSMNNYYQLESTLSSLRNSKISAIYSSEKQNSVTSKSSESDISDVEFKGCVCNKIAEKLNHGNISCCCKQKVRKDEETNCDLRNAEDLFLLNYKTEYVDVETQHSKYLSSKLNSLNVSIHSKNTSFIKTTKETKVVEQFEIIKEPKVKKFASNYSPIDRHSLENEMNVMNFDTYCNMNENDQLIAVNNKYAKVKNTFEANDINEDYTNCEPSLLQSYEAKKAVLEIYAEKAENGDHYVAKLPKFIHEKESEITRNYKQIATNSYKSVCKQNIVMSIQRS